VKLFPTTSRAIRSNPPSANLYVAYMAQDDAPVVKAFLNIVHPAAHTGTDG
jgi:hypothetical protein